MEWIQAHIQIITQQVKLRARLMQINLVTVPPSLEFSFTALFKEVFMADRTVPDDIFKLGPSDTMSGIFDSVDIVEIWLTIKNMFADISRVASDRCSVWHYVNEFLDGSRQESLPIGYQGESRVHLQFSPEQINEIKRAGWQKHSTCLTRVNEFFTAASSTNNALANVNDGYLFIPADATCLGSVRHLTQILFMLVTMFKQLSGAFKQLSGVKVVPQAVDFLKNRLAVVVRERCTTAVCSIWIEDCKKLASLADWTLSPPA